MARPDSNTGKMTKYISVGEALKLVEPFKGEKRDVLSFIANVDTAFEVIDPRNEGDAFETRGQPLGNSERPDKMSGTPALVSTPGLLSCTFK